jgi:NTP pyrophosphatase (non-canonical NTP hydrolase)
MNEHPGGLIEPSLLRELLEFRNARRWEQFHTPKNLASAISVEAAELLEHFIWEVDPSQTETISRHRSQIEAEVADLVILLSYFIHDLSIDVNKAVSAKLTSNVQKYPAEAFRGSNRKYSDV